MVMNAQKKKKKKRRKWLFYTARSAGYHPADDSKYHIVGVSLSSYCSGDNSRNSLDSGLTNEPMRNRLIWDKFNLLFTFTCLREI